MIDMHCHLLPGIDDGAQDLDTALEMARIAVADGIQYAVMTPHISVGRIYNDRRTIRWAVESMRSALSDAGIPLRIGLGSELSFDLGTVEMLGREEIPMLGQLGDFEILLLEFPESHIPAGAQRFVERLIRQKIRPVLAHPERNQEIINNYNKIEPFIKAGCYIQITAGSITGEFGRPARRCAKHLLQLPAFKAIASDAHNADERRPVLSRAVAVAGNLIGERAAADLVYANPASILFGRRMAPRRMDRRMLRRAGFGIVQPRREQDRRI